MKQKYQRTSGFFPVQNTPTNKSGGVTIVGKLFDSVVAYAYYDYPPWEDAPDGPTYFDEILATKVDPLK